jgi:hypothetical protein
MKEFEHTSIEEILDKMTDKDLKKMEFAEYFMINKMGIESIEDSKIVIGPTSAEVLMSLLASLLIEWDQTCNTKRKNESGI